MTIDEVQMPDGEKKNVKCRRVSLEDPFLFMIGVPKSGTTSLFDYLSQHPQINPCSVKEPGFFLPLDDYMNPDLKFGHDSVQKYLDLFPSNRGAKVNIEGTTMYFRCPEIADTLLSTMPNSRVLVSLREPISRLVSFYQMGQYGGWIPLGTSFDELVAQMLNPEPHHHIGTRLLLEEGLYSQSLGKWRNVFKDGKMHVVWFDDIKRNPTAVMVEISQFLDLDPSIYQDYVFQKRLVAKQHRFAKAHEIYAGIKRRIKKNLAKHERFSEKLSNINRFMLSNFEPIFTRPAQPLFVKRVTLERLLNFYRKDLDDLERITGRRPPWADSYALEEIPIQLLSTKIRLT